MSTLVVKKDGSKEPFSKEKVENAIRAAAKDTDIGSEELERVIKEVAREVEEEAREEEIVSSREVREEILDELEEAAPQVAEAWRAYEKKK